MGAGILGGSTGGFYKAAPALSKQFRFAFLNCRQIFSKISDPVEISTRTIFPGISAHDSNIQTFLVTSSRGASRSSSRRQWWPFRSSSMAWRLMARRTSGTTCSASSPVYWSESGLPYRATTILDSFAVRCECTSNLKSLVFISLFYAEEGEGCQ